LTKISILLGIFKLDTKKYVSLIGCAHHFPKSTTKGFTIQIPVRTHNLALVTCNRNAKNFQSYDATVSAFRMDYEIHDMILFQ